MRVSEIRVKQIRVNQGLGVHNEIGQGQLQLLQLSLDWFTDEQKNKICVLRLFTYLDDMGLINTQAIFMSHHHQILH